MESLVERPNYAWENIEILRSDNGRFSNENLIGRPLVGKIIAKFPSKVEHNLNTAVCFSDIKVEMRSARTVVYQVDGEQYSCMVLIGDEWKLLTINSPISKKVNSLKESVNEYCRKHQYGKAWALLQEVNKGPHKGLPMISVAHFYAAGSEICENEHSERLVIGGQDCVEADVVGKNVCYTALGHLHKAQKVKSAVREMQYSGSPIPMSFSESHYQHGLTLVEFDAAGNVETQRIVYTPQRPLTTLPARGSARTSEILRMIESLPQRRKNDSGESWPYLELRIEENQPEPTLLYQITTALEDKAVHFCRVVRVYQRENTLSATHQTTNMLQELSPVEMADLVYKDMYEEPLPEELKQRLIIAEEAALSE
jgi:DNA repair exonuclease SbcCD nuclease subunit